MIASYKLPIWPPSTNTIYRNVRGKTLLSKDARRFYRDGRHFIRTPDIPHPGLFHVELDFWPPHKGTFDVDNRVKAVFDLLTKCNVWTDDRYVLSFTATKHKHIAHAMVVIKLFNSPGDNGHAETDPKR